MRIPQKIWLLVLTAGLLFAGAALVSGAVDTPVSGGPAAIASVNDSGAAPVIDESVSVENCADTDADSVSAETSPPLQNSDQACLDCHSDQERVQALAVEEVAAESLSEGPG